MVFIISVFSVYSVCSVVFKVSVFSVVSRSSACPSWRELAVQGEGGGVGRIERERAGERRLSRGALALQPQGPRQPGVRGSELRFPMYRLAECGQGFRRPALRQFGLAQMRPLRERDP